MRSDQVLWSFRRLQNFYLSVGRCTGRDGTLESSSWLDCKTLTPKEALRSIQLSRTVRAYQRVGPRRALLNKDGTLLPESRDVFTILSTYSSFITVYPGPNISRTDNVGNMLDVGVFPYGCLRLYAPTHQLACRNALAKPREAVM